MKQSLGNAVQDFCGTWKLLTEESNYSLGSPPASGTYSIKLVGEKVLFHVSWEEQSEQTYQVEFSGIPDGEKHPFKGQGVDFVKYEITADGKFISAAYKDRNILNEATRSLSADKTQMFVTQRILGQDGQLHANYSVYSKE
ncbi:hypothetical protein [Niallia sp. FSL R7-0271]|uniref:hypothetical protein n=1 Tax=Niallia sp. FSL R7-0271 TaxID=2921678 RepID=UPI0030F7FE9D